MRFIPRSASIGPKRLQTPLSWTSATAALPPTMKERSGGRVEQVQCFALKDKTDDRSSGGPDVRRDHDGSRASGRLNANDGVAALGLHQHNLSVQTLRSWRHDRDIVGTYTERQVAIIRRTQRSREWLRKPNLYVFDRERVRRHTVDRQQHH